MEWALFCYDLWCLAVLILYWGLGCHFPSGTSPFICVHVCIHIFVNLHLYQGILCKNFWIYSRKKYSKATTTKISYRIFYFGAGDYTHGLVHATEVLYHWPASQPCFYFIYSFILAKSYCIAQSGFKIRIFLPPPPKRRDYRCLLPCPSGTTS